MIEIVTPTSNSICNIETQNAASFSVFTETENSFYESIKPALNILVKEPSDESIQRVLNVSKSM